MRACWLHRRAKARCESAPVRTATGQAVLDESEQVLWHAGAADATQCYRSTSYSCDADRHRDVGRTGTRIHASACAEREPTIAACWHAVKMSVIMVQSVAFPR